jgi:hypothetical protein
MYISAEAHSRFNVNTLDESAGGALVMKFTKTAVQSLVPFTLNDTTHTGCVTATSGVVSIASGTNCSIVDVQVVMPTVAITANTCFGSALNTEATVTMTGVTTTMAFSASPTTNPAAVTGWGSSGGLVLWMRPTANTLNWQVCNQTASSITPGALTMNVSAR